MVLSFDRSARVLMARISGIYGSQDMAELDQAVIRFLAREGQVNALYDFSGVETVAVPESRIAERGSRPTVVQGQRVIVASRSVGGNLSCSFGTYQRIAGHRPPTIVSSLAEAYAILGIKGDAAFEPVEAT
jgi:hypothetical protein